MKASKWNIWCMSFKTLPEKEMAQSHSALQLFKGIWVSIAQFPGSAVSLYLKIP